MDIRESTGPIMSKASFIVAFEGPGVRDGSIDVRDLAPALLSLGQLVDAANRAVNGDNHPARLHAKAVSHGSFEVSLDVVLSGWEYVRDILLSDDVDGAKQLVEWIGIVATPTATLFGVYRFLKGRKPDAVRRSGGRITIELDGQSLEVPLEVLRIYQDVAVNDAVQRLTDSLESEAIDAIEFRDPTGGSPTERLTAADREAFVLPEPERPVLTDETRQMALSIRSLAFQEGNKWRLFDGQNVITATIEDSEFLRRVERNIVRFAKSDILVCEVRTVQRQTKTGLQTEHFVKKVVEYRSAPSQIELFSFED